VLNLKKLKYTLPPVDIAAGFLGLDTIGTSYFENKNLLKFKQELRIKALQVLSKNGFTSFSGLPSVQVTKNNEKLDFDDQDLKEILNVSSKLKMSKSIFTYSGGFPKNILNFSKSKTDYTQVNNYISSLNKLYNQKIVYTFSDEAAGYSNKVEEDILKAQKLKTNIPKLLLGGFSGMYSNTKKLNSYFDYGFYSSLKKGDIVDIKNKGHFWGTYNGSVMPMNDPQFSFGVGLYFMEEIGLNHYLDWHLNATHNYPYFEFDGRETDSVMFYPRSNGDLYTSIKFEHAVLGLNIYRKLKLLDSLQSKMKPDLLNSYKTFKLVLRDGLDPYRFNDYYHKHTINSIDVSSKLSKFIGSID
jgi:hypothetical protein